MIVMIAHYLGSPLSGLPWMCKSTGKGIPDSVSDSTKKLLDVQNMFWKVVLRQPSKPLTLDSQFQCMQLTRIGVTGQGNFCHKNSESQSYFMLGHALSILSRNSTISEVPIRWHQSRLTAQSPPLCPHKNPPNSMFVFLAVFLEVGLESSRVWQSRNLASCSQTQHLVGFPTLLWK